MSNVTPVLNVDECTNLEDLLLQGAGSQIRIMRSPYSGKPGILINTDMAGLKEIQSSTLAEGLMRLREELLTPTGEVAVDDRPVEETGPDVDDN